MEKVFDKTLVTLKQGDITQENVDAIVNAANSGLLGGGGVDGAIHRAGGPTILEACKKIRETQGRCPTGQAVITHAGNLNANHVVHTVGPIWQGGNSNEEQLLHNAYTNSLQIASDHGDKTIAFPSISTGAYGFPIDKAAPIALKAVRDFALENDHFQEVRFVLFSSRDLQVYENALNALN